MALIEVLENGAKRSDTIGLLTLLPVSWNDWWEYSNLYTASYTSQDGGKVELGHVKIQDPTQLPQETPKHPIDVGFSECELPGNVISLGQGDEYYRALASLPEREREALCLALKDAVWEPGKLRENRKQSAVRKSLLRSVSYTTVLGEYHRIVRNEGEADYYRLNYRQPEFQAHFIVDPKAKPRTNLHTIIGRNGVGKTTLLRNITRLLATGDTSDPSQKIEILRADGASEGLLAAVQYVSWSAFDSFPSDMEWDFSDGVSYSKVGVSGIWQATPGGKLERPAVIVMPDTPLKTKPDNEKPAESFVRAFSLVVERRRNKLWSEALESLESDPVFRRLKILKELREMLDEATEGVHSLITYESLATAFEELSDGHKVVLLSITYLAATLAERTLVVLDEPEAHLHPPLLASMIRCLNELLIKKNAMAIVATHSPVVLQEVPKNCAWKLQRNRSGKMILDQLEIETYGEDVGALTYEVFGLEVPASGFYATLEELSSRHDDFSNAIAELDGHLGVMGRSVLRSLIADKHDTSPF